MLNSVFWNRLITRKNKLLIYNSIVKITVTYGTKTWKFNKNLESKLMSMEIRHFEEIGEMFKIRKKIEKMNIKNSVLDYIRYKQLNCHKHMQRIDQERLPRRILEWCPPGRRRKGRPRNSWIQEDTTGIRERGIGMGQQRGVEK